MNATLIDGRQVDTASEDYRHECEARYILRLPRIQDRQTWLHLIEKSRGAMACAALKATMTALHAAKQWEV